MNMQEITSIKQLNTGDIITHKGSGQSYVVIHGYGDHVVAVRTVDVSNPSEWLVLKRDIKK